MRCHSTRESVKNGEYTWLAIIECFVAIAIYIGIAIDLKTFRYYAVAIALAPLTLLRTDDAVKWGLDKYEGIINWAERKAQRVLRGKSADEVLRGEGRSYRISPAQRMSVLFSLLFPVFIVPLAGTCIRLFSIAYCTAKGPIASLKEMPNNWLRQSLCTDLSFPPEIVSGDVAGSWGFNELLDIFKAFPRIFRAQPRLIILFPFLLGPVLLAFLLPLMYRVTFKATCVAYAPFVWVARATIVSVDMVKLRLERITKGELEKARRWFAGLVLMAVAVKIALYFHFITAEKAADTALLASLPFVEAVLVPKVWTWWQLFLAVDALITFVLLWYADAALARIGPAANQWREDVVGQIVAAASFVRATSSVLTMSYFFWLALATVLPGRAWLVSLGLHP